VCRRQLGMCRPKCIWIQAPILCLRKLNESKEVIVCLSTCLVESKIKAIV